MRYHQPMNGDDLKDWRERLKLSKAEASRLLGCSRRAFGEWEAGRNRIPEYISLACAAVAYGLPPIGKGRNNDGD